MQTIHRRRCRRYYAVFVFRSTFHWTSCRHRDAKHDHPVGGSYTRPVPVSGRNRNMPGGDRLLICYKTVNFRNSIPRENSKAYKKITYLRGGEKSFSTVPPTESKHTKHSCRCVFIFLLSARRVSYFLAFGSHFGICLLLSAGSNYFINLYAIPRSID